MDHIICFLANAIWFSHILLSLVSKPLRREITVVSLRESQMFYICQEALLATHPHFSLLVVSMGQPIFFIVVYMLR